MRRSLAYTGIATALLPFFMLGAQRAPSMKPTPGAQLSAEDSVGATLLAKEFAVLPNGLRLSGLRMEQYRSAALSGRGPVLGPFGAVFEIPAREDSIVVQLSFEWTAEDALAVNVPEDPTISSIYFSWIGRDERAFAAVYRRVHTALVVGPLAPSCVDLKTDIFSTELTRRSREAAWRAGGWYSGLFVRASRDSSGAYFSVQFRASRNPALELKPTLPVKAGWECLPRLREVLGPFKRNR